MKAVCKRPSGSGSEGLLLCAALRVAAGPSLLPGTAGREERLGALAEVCGAFFSRGGTDAFFAAVRAGGLVRAAGKNKVAALGLTAVDHTGHLSLSKGYQNGCPINLPCLRGRAKNDILAIRQNFGSRDER